VVTQGAHEETLPLEEGAVVDLSHHGAPTAYEQALVGDFQEEKLP
jgi:hypothetical protein